MSLFDLENLTDAFSDFIRIEPLQQTAEDRDLVRRAALLIFEDVYKRYRVTLLNPWGWRTAYKRFLLEHGTRIELSDWTIRL